MVIVLANRMIKARCFAEKNEKNEKTPFVPTSNLNVICH